MPAKKTAVKKVAGGSVVKNDELEVDKNALAAAHEESESTEAEEAHDELLNKMDATGQFVVRQNAEGKMFRLYNELGQAVSPVSEDITLLSKQASRANIMNKQRGNIK